MANNGSRLRGWFTRSGGDYPSLEAVADLLEPQLEPDEDVEYYLPGKGSIERKSGETVEQIEPSPDGGSFLALTDRKLLFAVVTTTGEVIIDIPHIDVRDVEVEKGRLKSKLSIEIWDEGIYRFRPARNTPMDEAVAFLESVSRCWQRVDTLIDELQVKTAELGELIEAGQLNAANGVYQEALGTLGEAEAAIDEADLESVLQPRLEDALRNIHRTRMRARLARAMTLATEAKHQTDAGAYTDAYERYERAREHLNQVLEIADEHGFEEPPVVQARLEDIEGHIDNLRVRPLALAKQAQERAEETDHPGVEAQAWEEAFEHYRDALTAGWGTDYKFSGDRNQIRFRVEVTVAKLIRARMRNADELETNGDEARADDAIEKATYRYEQAIDQLAGAAELATEFDAGDSEKLQARIDRIQAKLETLD